MHTPILFKIHGRQVSYKYLYFILDPIYILCICYLLFEFTNKYCLNYLRSISFSLSWLCNLFFPINIGTPIQYVLVLTNSAHPHRKCNICNTKNSDDEFHYLFRCNDEVILEARNRYLPRTSCIKPNEFKFRELFNIEATWMSLTIFANFYLYYPTMSSASG